MYEWRKNNSYMKKVISILVLTAVSVAAFARKEVSDSPKTGILDLNPAQKVLPVLLTARTSGGTWDKPATEEAVTFLHFSDLHGCTANLERIVEFYGAYSEYIADAIHTGDVVAGYWDNPNPWNQVKGAEKILNVVGNHDCWKGHKVWAESEIPYDASAEDAYKTIMAPFIKGWNVTQPTGVSDRNSENWCACYYYKDYPKSKLRLIVLDCMHDRDGGAQVRWFENVLQDAADKGLTVVCAEHYFAQTGLASVDSGFSTNPYVYGCYDPDKPQIECLRDVFFTCVDKFIDNGGAFVCWLSGHDHEDYIGLVCGHERQLQILVGKAGEKDIYIHEDRTPGTLNQDLFNLVTVNPSKHLLVIQRIGCNVGPQMRSKNIFSFDYLSRNIVVKE